MSVTMNVKGTSNHTFQVSKNKDGGVEQGYSDFKTTATIADAVGRLKWNDGDGTLEVGLKGGASTLQIGQENIVRIYNNTGAQLNDGQVVYVTGAQGQRPTVALADADLESTSSRTIGVVTENIANATEGFVTTFGLVRGLNTDSFNEGDTVYISSTAGALTNVKPTFPMHTVIVGYVVRKHAAAGSIFVNVSNGLELNEIHDMNLTSVQPNQMISRNAANTGWENTVGLVWDEVNDRLGVKTTDPTFGVTYLTTTGIVGIGGDGSENAASTGALILANNRPTPTSGDICGGIEFISKGSGTGSQQVGARIRSVSSGTGGANGFGQDLLFFTKSDNSASGAVEKARLSSSGFFGVGTTTPQAKVHVSKSATTVAGVDTTENGLVLSGGLTGTSTEKTNRLSLYAFGSGSNNIRLAHGGAASSESSPVYPNNLTSLGSLTFAGWDENTSSWQGGATITVVPEVTWNSTTRDSTMRFFTAKGTVGSERMRITSNGNLLIGSTTDDTTNKLQVWGSGALKSTGSASDLKFYEGSSGSNYIRILGQEVLSADYTLTLPAKTGTLATLDDVTGGAGSTTTGVVFVNEFTNGVEFTAGTSTTLTLPTAETGNGHIVAFDGVIQFQSQYSIVGTTVTFTSAIPLGVNKVQILRGLGASSTSAPTVTKTANYTATASDYTIRCDATSGTLTITLPAAAAFVGKIYNIKKVDTTGNVVLVDPSGAETIDSDATHTISLPYANLTIQSNGAGWDIL